MSFKEKVEKIISRKLTDREAAIADELEQSGQHLKYTNEDIKTAFAALETVNKKRSGGL